MAFEESPDTFYQRFSSYAVPVELLPQPYGYPLLEALTPIGVIYAFDRGAPPTPIGRADVLFAATAASFRYRSGRPQLEQLPGGRARLTGKVRERLGTDAFLFDVGIPLVLNSSEPLEVGAALEVLTAPVLMAFPGGV